MIAICSRFCNYEGVKDSRQVDNEKNYSAYIVFYFIDLLCLSVGGVRLQILGKKPSSLFNYYNRMTYKYLLP